MSFPRLDRLATLYFFYPIKKKAQKINDIYIPILMYHSISVDTEEGTHPYYRVNTSPEIFDRHMRHLHENNYSVIRLSDAIKILTEKTNQPINQSTGQPGKYAVITFDDGFRDFYTRAFPILKKNNFTATVFLPTGFIGNKGLGLTGKKHLSWNEIRELYSNGVTFGSHTVTHPRLKFLKKEEVECEIRRSKEDIENKLGQPVNSFSYPFAFPDEDESFIRFLKGVLQKYGYKYGVSTRIGIASKKDEFYFTKRIPVNSCDDNCFFKAKLCGAYDWLGKPQYLIKLLKRNILTNRFRSREQAA